MLQCTCTHKSTVCNTSNQKYLEHLLYSTNASGQMILKSLAIISDYEFEAHEMHRPLLSVYINSSFMYMCLNQCS